MAGERNMKVVVASHSMIAERQFWFWNYVDTLPGVQILKLAPRDWTNHHVDWGYEVARSSAGRPWQYPSNIDIPDMGTFVFPDQALAAIEDFKPDIIYVQNEAACRVSAQMHRMAGRLGCKFALFVWENIRPYDQLGEEVRRVLSGADLVVCGNGDAEKLVRPYNPHTLRCAQVGVSTVGFCPIGEKKDYDLIFRGRMTPEKGVEVLKRAAEGTDWKILWPTERVPYAYLPRRFNQARVHVGHSLDTEFWVEQHGNYANYEALSCGLRVATSHSRCIVEALQGCPGVMFDPQGDSAAMKRTLEILLEDRSINLEGRKWIEKHYGYEKVAGMHLAAFDGVLQ